MSSAELPRSPRIRAGTLAALKRMRERDCGTIVQVGSALAYRSIPLQATYYAAKHAIKGFTESLWCELLHDKSNVHVTMVQLPGLNTPQFAQVKKTLPKHPRPWRPSTSPSLRRTQSCGLRSIGAGSSTSASRHRS